jgi:hypothetical protein
MDGRISNTCQIVSARRYVMTDGDMAGIEVIDCDNGRIRFLLNVSCALDVMQLYHRGTNVSFVSKNGFGRQNAPFLNRFEGGMIYTCGLDSVGGCEGFELHGSLHKCRAKIDSVVCDDNGIETSATVRHSALFGDNLCLKRKITTKPGSDTLILEDTLTNEGYKEAKYALLYHTNVGYPMLDEGAYILSNATKVAPRSDYAKENIKRSNIMSLPEADKQEECYYLDLPDATVSVVNERIGKQLTVSYSKTSLPYFIEWKSMVSGDYALGLEPTTTLLDDSFAYQTIKSGGSVIFSVALSVCDLAG